MGKNRGLGDTWLSRLSGLKVIVELGVGKAVLLGQTYEYLKLLCRK